MKGKTGTDERPLYTSLLTSLTSCCRQTDTQTEAVSIPNVLLPTQTVSFTGVQNVLFECYSKRCLCM